MSLLYERSWSLDLYFCTTINTTYKAFFLKKLYTQKKYNNTIIIKDCFIIITMMNPRSLFLVSLACLFVHLLVVQAQAAPSSVHLTFDLSTQTYGDLWAKLRRQLRQPSVPEYEPASVKGRYVLGPRRPEFHGTPLGWIMVHVTGEAQEDKTTLAIANDDLYLLGFRNSTEHWYILKSFGGLPGAITLPFTESYYDLVGGHMNLPTVPLGKQSAIEAVKTLASCCDDFDTTTEAQVKQALVRFVVMIAEAARFPAIRDTFSSSQKWQQETFIAEKQAKPVVHWGKLSTLLVIWEKYHNWDSGRGNEVKDIGVNGPLDALKLVDFLCRPLNI